MLPAASLRRAGTIGALSIALATTATAAQLPAPPDSVLAAEAEGFVQRRRLGAGLLWGGLLVASLIIGVVRARGRSR